MSVESWLVFSACAIAMLAFPSPLAGVVATFSVARGRRTAFATVPGAAIGLTLMFTAAAVITGLAAAISATVLETLRWAGMVWLVFFGLWLWAIPAFSGRTADNDNLPAKGFGGILATCFREACRPRYFLFFSAILPQFVQTGDEALNLAAQMQAVILAIAALCLTVQAVMPQRTLTLLRRISTRRMPTRRPGRIIARPSVSAGYRRIAA